MVSFKQLAVLKGFAIEGIMRSFGVSTGCGPLAREMSIMLHFYCFKFFFCLRAFTVAGHSKVYLDFSYDSNLIVSLLNLQRLKQNKNRPEPRFTFSDTIERVWSQMMRQFVTHTRMVVDFSKLIAGKLTVCFFFLTESLCFARAKSILTWIERHGNLKNFLFGLFINYTIKFA